MTLFTPPLVTDVRFVLRQLFAAGSEFGTNMVGLLSEEEIAAWDARNAVITENWRWFTGEALEERDTTAPGKNGQYPLLFPLQLNPFKDGARLHAYCLWGMVQETSAPLVQTKCDPRKDENGEITDEARKIAAEADEVLLDVDFENNSRAMDIDMGLASQGLGGVVLKVAWEPNNPLRPSGIRYEWYDPRNFYARWRGKDYWNLEEAWIRRVISKTDAKLSYNVDIEGREGTYLEYWNKSSFWIAIDGHPAQWKDAQGNWTDLAGAHDLGFVPIIYVPHERVNDFWGRSIVDGNIGLVKEINSREADVGDAIHMGVHSVLVAKNLRGGGAPAEKTLSNGVVFYDLGRATGTDPEPEMTRVGAPELPNGTDSFVERLRENLRNGLLTPSIAYGEEEGSQRSGQTLYNRMWPLLSHVSHERINWTEARNLRAEMVLRILAQHNHRGITEKHLNLRKRQMWQPMVPVDRAALVDEMVKRMQVKGISLQHFIEMLGDVTDIEEEIERIWADVERMSEIESRLQEMQLEAQMELAEKEMKNEQVLADKQQKGQERLADKQAQTQIRVARARPTSNSQSQRK